MDNQLAKNLELKIDSYSLRKALERQVKKVYLNMGVFTEFKRTSPEMKVQKSRTFRQQNFLKGFAKKNSQEDSQKTAELGFCDSQ